MTSQEDSTGQSAGKPRGGISKLSSKLPNTTARTPIGGVPTCHEVAVKLIFFYFRSLISWI